MNFKNETLTLFMFIKNEIQNTEDTTRQMRSLEHFLNTVKSNEQFLSLGLIDNMLIQVILRSDILRARSRMHPEAEKLYDIALQYTELSKRDDIKEYVFSFAKRFRSFDVLCKASTRIYNRNLHYREVRWAAEHTEDYNTQPHTFIRYAYACLDKRQARFIEKFCHTLSAAKKEPRS